MSVKDFASLVKPGIVLGNLISAVGGFCLGSHGHFQLQLFLNCLLGISLIIGCAGVFNNIFDRDIDQLMERTQNRVLVKRLIQLWPAFIFGLLLGVTGLAVLALATNKLAVMLALVGLFIYLVIYTFLLKRNSIHATLIGGLSGGLPPAIGYCAATNRFDLPALLLILALCFWQIPHSYAIGILYTKDFQRAKIPLFPVLRSALNSKMAMLIYALLFFAVTMLFPFLGYTGLLYTLTVGLSALIWIILIANGFWATQDEIWARRVFLSSLIVITIFSLSLI
ncbi:MAG: heme o synthase [Pseudomonadota bacterium]